jgi:hypothetical protein
MRELGVVLAAFLASGRGTLTVLTDSSSLSAMAETAAQAIAQGLHLRLRAFRAASLRVAADRVGQFLCDFGADAFLPDAAAGSFDQLLRRARLLR